MVGHPAPRWRVSSYSSGNNGNCVEVAPVCGGAWVRDSKDRVGPVHQFASAGWRSFLTAVRSGRAG